MTVRAFLAAAASGAGTRCGGGGGGGGGGGAVVSAFTTCAGGAARRPVAAVRGSSSAASASASASFGTVRQLVGDGYREGRRTFGSTATTLLKASAAASDDEDQNKQQQPKDEKRPKPNKSKPKKKKGKIRVNPRWREEADLNALSAEFDKMARREGFDSTQAFYADGDTFDDEFDAAAVEKDLPEGVRMSDADMEAAVAAAGTGGIDGGDDDGDDDFDLDLDLDLDPDDFSLEDFESDDDYLDFGSEFDEAALAGIGAGKAKAAATDGDDGAAAQAAARDQSMADRILAAGRDMDLGRVSVDDDLDTFAKDVTETDLRKLGFRKEANPFGDDETPRRDAFVLVTDAMVCSACGADFQCKDDGRPGFLPPDKFEVQAKLGKIEDVQRLQDKAESDESWSPEDEIEWLIRNEGGGDGDGKDGAAAAATDGIDVQAMADEMGLDLVELTKNKVICKRCHGLQNFGEVDERLRPGWTEEPLLSQEAFRDLLRPIGDKTAVIIALVDLFDFSGSVLPELDAIAKDNPVILAANKADLLPSKMGQARAENWVRRELEYLGVKSIANVGGAVRLVSCKTGFGLSGMIGKARGLAEEMECDIYLVGAANAGKSTLINRILAKNEEKTAAHKFGKKKKRAGNATARKGAVTVSPLPGTTLKFIEVNLGNNMKLYDTPGLLVPGTLTQRLTPAELKMVVPKKEVEPVTFRIASGKCVLVGGLARIEIIGDSKPFLFTFFVSNDVKLHPTDTSRADDFVAKHAGGMLTPPLEPGPERMEQIGEFESHIIDIEGAGWKEAAADITLRGLGWVAVTGAGTAKVKVSVPKDVGVTVRPPLMPFDVWEATARYTGGRAVRKGGKMKSGKQRKGVGRR